MSASGSDAGDAPTSSTTTTPSSSATTQSSTTASSTAAVQSSTTSTSSSTAAPSSSSSSSTPSSTRQTTSTSIVVVTQVTTINGSASSVLVSSTMTSTGPVASGRDTQNASTGLSSGAKAGIIGGVAGGGGAILLGILLFFLIRWYRRRRSDYTPGADEIRWPEVEQDSSTLFPAAVRQTGGAGLGREPSMSQQSMNGTITSAGYHSSAADTWHNAQPTYPSQHPANGGFSSYGPGAAGLGAGAVAGAGAAAYYGGGNNRESVYSSNDYMDDQVTEHEHGYPYRREESLRSQPGTLGVTNFRPDRLDAVEER